jgi:cytosine/adenosine deaminase-related metal-dependent hydrolase
MLLPDREVEHGAVLVKGDRIAAVGTAEDFKGAGVPALDYGDCVLSPDFSTCILTAVWAG